MRSRVTRMDVMFWFGVAPTNLFVVATASEAPSAESVAYERFWDCRSSYRLER